MAYETQFTVNKYLQIFAKKQTLSLGELRAIITLLNRKATAEQVHKLVMAAENCNCLTPKGLLKGFSSRVDAVFGDTIFKPIYADVPVSAVANLPIGVNQCKF